MDNQKFVVLNNVKEKQKILLYLFKKYHDLCEENGLVYNAFGGTMLGAIRHKGFIPWDDDIDVTMPRDDYQKLIDIIKKTDNKILTVHCYPDNNYIYPYAKLGLINTIQYENAVKAPFNKLTINMDIFPVDGYPNNEDEIDEYCSYEEDIIFCTYKKNISDYLKHPKSIQKSILSNCKGYKYWVQKQIELASKNKIDDRTNLICNGAGWGRKGIIKKEVYFDRVLYEFEDTRIWGVRDYDEHMSKLYGDYMKLPPIGKRISPHDDRAFVSREYYSKIVAENIERKETKL